MSSKDKVTSKSYTPFQCALNKLMNNNGTTHSELAKYLGKTRQAVSYYCSGQSAPDFETLVKIANYFNTTSDHLLGIEPSPEKKPSAVDELGLNPTVVWCIKELNNRKGNDDSSNGPSTIDVLNEFLEKSLRSVIFYEMVRELKASVDREHNAKLSTIILDGLAEFAAANPAHEYMVVEAMLRSKIREEYPELNDRFLVIVGARSLKPRVDEICDLFREMLENITGYKQLKEG